MWYWILIDTINSKGYNAITRSRSHAQALAKYTNNNMPIINTVYLYVSYTDWLIHWFLVQTLKQGDLYLSG